MRVVRDSAGRSVAWVSVALSGGPADGQRLWVPARRMPETLSRPGPGGPCLYRLDQEAPPWEEPVYHWEEP